MDGWGGSEILSWGTGGEAFEAMLSKDCGPWCEGDHAVVAQLSDGTQLVTTVFPRRPPAVRSPHPVSREPRMVPNRDDEGDTDSA
ncbi:hypothetical protein D2E51_08125 [Mycobacteroides abscessus]|nr:hypothetical protein D2E51_08125 [Mycobacteroides abscessus]